MTDKPKLQKRDTTDVLAAEVKRGVKAPLEKEKPLRFDHVISTGSTVLDLNISGGRVRGGGVPGGIIVEIYGPSAAGKTSVLAEMCSSAQAKGGQAKFQDPEARLDKEYSIIYGMTLRDKEDYTRPNTVVECFDNIKNWKPTNPDVVNIVGTDSLAALSTEMEMESEDKRGQKRAKDFSQELRKIARVIALNNWLIACTNQLRSGEWGEVTPGGMAIPYYSSLRMRVAEVSKIEKTKKIGEKDIKKVIGIKSSVYIKKSTVDDPYRQVEIFIMFGYGIDDIRGNLQWYKDMTKGTKYECGDGKSYVSLDQATMYVEKNGLEKELKERVIDLWEKIEEKFKEDRKPKVRG